MSSIAQILGSSSFIIVNKTIIKKVGLEAAILLGELISEFEYWNTRNELEDGYFFSTIENIELKTTLSKHKQNNAIAKLKQFGLIDTQLKGLPAKRYIKINELKIMEILNIKPIKQSKKYVF